MCQKKEPGGRFSGPTGIPKEEPENRPPWSLQKKRGCLSTPRFPDPIKALIRLIGLIKFTYRRLPSYYR